MKRCPTCQRAYLNDTVRFCRDDGIPLVLDSSSSGSANTLLFPQSRTGERLRQQFDELSPSIAVPPFVNMSADPENDYFCDGLAEELLNALAEIDGLKVAGIYPSAWSNSLGGEQVNLYEVAG